MKGLALFAACALLVGACGTGPESGRVAGSPDVEPFLDAPSAVRAQAALTDANGSPIGLATFTEGRQSVEVNLRMSNLPPGPHGVHVHSVGKCDPPDFMTAGPHFNPHAKIHGILSPQGPHAGDLPNIEIGSDGHGTLVAFDPLVNLAPGSPYSLLSSGGLSIVVHKDPDDGHTDPAGNSGPRIACGVIKKIG